MRAVGTSTERVIEAKIELKHRISPGLCIPDPAVHSVGDEQQRLTTLRVQHIRDL